MLGLLNQIIQYVWLVSGEKWEIAVDESKRRQLEELELAKKHLDMDD
jgi:hypothetical protein